MYIYIFTVPLADLGLLPDRHTSRSCRGLVARFLVILGADTPTPAHPPAIERKCQLPKDLNVLLACSLAQSFGVRVGKGNMQVVNVDPPHLSEGDQYRACDNLSMLHSTVPGM